MECKYSQNRTGRHPQQVLIETLWNVNQVLEMLQWLTLQVLIETLWNVNLQ